MKLFVGVLVTAGTFAAGMLAFAPAMRAQQITVARGEVTVMVEPYAENVVRVSISLMKERATAAGYGISAKPEAGGWTKESGAGGDVLRSARMSVTVAPQGGKYTQTGTQADIAKFFGGSTPGVGISIKNADGSPLVQMRGWEMPMRAS